MTTVRFGDGEIEFRTGMLVFGEPTFQVEPASALLRLRTEADDPVEQAWDPETKGRRYGFPITLLYHAIA